MLAQESAEYSVILGLWLNLVDAYFRYFENSGNDSIKGSVWIVWHIIRAQKMFTIIIILASIYPITHSPPVYPSIHPPLLPFMHLSTHQSTLPSFLFFPPSFFYMLSAHACIHPSIHPPTHALTDAFLACCSLPDCWDYRNKQNITSDSTETPV